MRKLRAIKTVYCTFKDRLKVKCNRGALISNADAQLSTLLGEKSLHNQDWPLYYVNIRENARKRMAIYLGHNSK